MDGHRGGDDCALYHWEHEFRVIGYPRTIIASDLNSGDAIQDPKCDGPKTWHQVLHAEVPDGEPALVHVFTELLSDAEVDQCWRDACEGHDTTRGAIGDTFYCDGGCVGRPAAARQA